jgi:tetratricopeptide (TPR) repeat protein
MRSLAVTIWLSLASLAWWNPTPDGLVREGNAAYARGEYATALDQYTRAEERTTDPGLVAFNKAATLYQLGRYREAELHYRRCREDASGARLAQLLYGLGNCLVQQGSAGDVKLLDQAIAAYEECLAQAEADPGLLADVQHNLELARRLRQQRAPTGKPPDGTPDQEPTRPERRQPGGQPGEEEPNGSSLAKGKAEPRPFEKRQPGMKPIPVDQLPPPGKGDLPPVPDDDELISLSPEDAREHLRQSALRIAQELREHRRRSLLTPSRHVPDW